jgi:hypothetical protein
MSHGPGVRIKILRLFVAAEGQPSLCLLTADAFHPSVLVSGRPYGSVLLDLRVAHLGAAWNAPHS